MRNIKQCVSYILIVLGFIALILMGAKYHNLLQTPSKEIPKQQDKSDKKEAYTQTQKEDESQMRITPVTPVVPATINSVPCQTLPSREQRAEETFIAEVTAYTANDEGMDGRGITASGVKAKPYHTIAMDKRYPFGTKVKIEGFDCIFVVEDRGGAIKGNKIDLYMESKEEALEFGRRKLRVWILGE